MKVFGLTINEPIWLGQARHIYTAIAAWLLATPFAGKLPTFLVALLGETGTTILFTVVGSVIALVQLFKSSNAIEKVVSLRKVKFAGIKISPQTAGMIRQVLTFIGITTATLGFKLPSWFGLATSAEGVNMLFVLVGSITAYFQFLGSAVDPDKQIDEKQFMEMRKRKF